MVAMNWRDLDPEQARQEIDSDPTLRLLDVRTEAEFRRHRLPGATLVPVQELAQRLHELDPDANWLVHCEHGIGRSVLIAACVLVAAGEAPHGALERIKRARAIASPSPVQLEAFMRFCGARGAADLRFDALAEIAYRAAAVAGWPR